MIGGGEGAHEGHPYGDGDGGSVSRGLPGRVHWDGAFGCGGVEDGAGWGCDGGDHVAGLGVAKDG